MREPTKVSVCQCLTEISIIILHLSATALGAWGRHWVRQFVADSKLFASSGPALPYTTAAMMSAACIQRSQVVQWPLGMSIALW